MVNTVFNWQFNKRYGLTFESQDTIHWSVTHIVSVDLRQEKKKKNLNVLLSFHEGLGLDLHKLRPFVKYYKNLRKTSVKFLYVLLYSKQ